jgi:hypothetical protein
VLPGNQWLFGLHPADYRRRMLSRTVPFSFHPPANTSGIAPLLQRDMCPILFSIHTWILIAA